MSAYVYGYRNDQTVPLFNKDSGEPVGHLSEAVSIKDLKPGDVVWDTLNDEEAVFEGWSSYQGCYTLRWPSFGYFDGGFCAWDKDACGQPSMWRRVVMNEPAAQAA